MVDEPSADLTGRSGPCNGVVFFFVLFFFLRGGGARSRILYKKILSKTERPVKIPQDRCVCDQVFHLQVSHLLQQATQQLSALLGASPSDCC